MTNLLSTLPAFLAYFAIAVVLMFVFLRVYVKITPYNELKLIEQGLIAPAISLSGSLLGFVIAIASVVTHSVSLVDMLVWGVVALVIQLFAFFATRLLFPRLIDGIVNDNVAKGILLGMISVCFGLINSACMTY